VPTPASVIADNVVNKIAGTNNQYLKLFKRGNLISTVPNINGSIQLPKPPIATGITNQKIINKA
jgi:hypothetical protein